MKQALILLLTCLSTSAATINVTTLPEFKAAVLTNAVESDLVQILGAGFTIPNGIIIDRHISFTIAGQATNMTTLTSGNPPETFCIWIKSTSANPFTVHDLRCNGSTFDTSGFFLTGGNAGTTPTAGPIHFYNIYMPQVYTRGISPGSGDSFGLIDHCYFEAAQAGQFNPVAFFGNAYLSWANSNPYGTTNACYVEDCYFKTRVGWTGNGFFDAYNGAQFVIRHSVFDGNANNGNHGYDSQITSSRTAEIYDNVFTNIHSGNLLLDWRGGGLLWYSNKVSAPGTAISAITPELKLYRACDGSVNTIPNYVNVPQVITFTGNPSNGQQESTFFTTYTFVSSLGAVAGQVLIGATEALSISNFVQAIVHDPSGAGVHYSAATLSDPDVLVKSFDATSLTVTNRLDAVNGWPSAFQQGVIGMLPRTNNSAVRYPIYSWNNTINGTNFGFALSFQGDSCNGQTNYVDFLLQSGRDFFQDTDIHWVAPPVGYTPLVYPHPLSSYTPPTPPVTNGPSPIIITGNVTLKGGIQLKVAP